MKAFLCLVLLAFPAAAADVAAFKMRLQQATTRHLDKLLNEDGSVVPLKGKTADAQEALAFYLMFEATKSQRYRRAALELADRVLKAMRATKFGVLPIKEKEKEGGKHFIGGGPPALGFYTSSVAYILQREGGHDDDLKYVATVLDQYPWNDKGWWSQDIDVVTGESKVPMDKVSIINKSAAIAMAAGTLSKLVSDIDAPLAARLKHKTDQCIYRQIIPAQLEDGFWNYNLSGNNPKEKDILGYFMLTTSVLMELQHHNPAYHEPKLDSALKKAQDFALKCIAPMTDPNNGPPCAAHSTPGTPKHFSLDDKSKRGFELGFILLGAGHLDEGIKIMDACLEKFPAGDGGQDGGQAAGPSALALSMLR